MCVVLFGREYHVFLICFDSTTVGYIVERIRGSASAEIGKTSRQIYKKIGLEESISKHLFVQKTAKKVRTALSLFTVNDPWQLPSVNFDM